jgi:hypothetical protein
MNNVHDDHPVVFESRFVMSYLAGPLTRTQIQKLMAPRKAGASSTARAPATATTATATAAPPATAQSIRPVVPGGLPEKFVAAATPLTPALVGVAKAHYAQAKSDIDVWRELVVVAPLSPETSGDFWETAELTDKSVLAGATDAPPEGAQFAPLPRALDAKTAGKLDDALETWVYRAGVLRVLSAKALGLTSQPDETEAAFRGRVALAAREARDAAIDKVQAKYQPKLDALASSPSSTRSRASSAPRRIASHASRRRRARQRPARRSRSEPASSARCSVAGVARWARSRRRRAACRGPRPSATMSHERRCPPTSSASSAASSSASSPTMSPRSMRGPSPRSRSSS